MKIIPAIDIIDGKCIRLSKGDYDTKKIYSENPLEIAKEFEDSGIKYLHLVDLDGAKAQEISNYKTLEEIASKTNLIIDFGGGIKTRKDLLKAFECGADKITIGSIAVQNEDLCKEWIAEFSPKKIILGADCLDRKVKTSGWLENSGLDVVKFILKYQDFGIREVVCTDISKDGMLEGPSTELYREIISKTNINLIASGGISSMEDLENLNKIGCQSAILGKAIYEKKVSLKQLVEFQNT